MSSLLVYALSLLVLLFPHFTFYFLVFFLFRLSSLFSLLSLSLSICFLLFLPVVPYCARLRPFYTACHDKIYYFTPQPLLACCGCPSRTTNWSAGCLATTTILCWLRHVPFPDKGSFVLFYFLTFRGIPIRIRARHSLLLTPITRT